MNNNTKSKEEFLNEMIQKAEQGNKDAQFLVGEKYWCDGKISDAKYFLRKAARQNQPHAQLLLAKILYREFNYDDEALHWMCCSWVNGNPEATDFMNEILEENEEISREKAELEYNEFQRRIALIKEFGIDYETVSAEARKRFMKNLGIIAAITIVIMIIIISIVL